MSHRVSFLPALLIAGLLLCGCDASTGELVAGLGGSIPTSGTSEGSLRITALNADPSKQSVEPGDAVTLSIEAVPEPDSVRWMATGGSLSSTSGNPVTWTAPAEAGAYVIDVTAEAGADTAHGSFRFVVQ